MSRLAPHRQRGFGLIAALVLVFLYAPIAVLVFFSFNAGRLFHRFDGFSLAWYGRAFANNGFHDAALNTLIVAVSAAFLATLLATGAALGLQAMANRGRRECASLILDVPLVLPEVVMAIATLIFFSFAKAWIGFDLGLGNLVLAHTAFCLPFALMPIRASLAGLDSGLAVAAADLYAGRWQTLRRVTLPLLLPGIGSGAALAFIVSFDDFAMSQFVAGPGQTTLPVFIWAQLKRPLTPEVNAMCALMLAVSVLFICLSVAIVGRRQASSQNIPQENTP